MAILNQIPTLSSVVSNAYSDSNQAKQELATTAPVGITTVMPSNVAIKSSFYARSREDALSKYVTTRFSMNGAIKNENDVLFNSFGTDYLNVEKGTGNSIPVSFQPGTPPLFVGHSIKFNGANEGLYGPNNALNPTTLSTGNFQIETTFKITSAKSQMLWGIENNTNGFYLNIGSDMKPYIYTYTGTGTNTTVLLNNTALALNTWYVATVSINTSGSYLTINGVDSGLAFAARPILIDYTNTRLVVGYSKLTKSLGSNNTLVGNIEDLVIYNGQGEDRANWWGGETIAGNTKYSILWRFRSSYVYRNAPEGWSLMDGAAVSREEYSALFDRVGVIGGTGNGTTTFNIPTYPTALPANYYGLIRVK